VEYTYGDKTGLNKYVTKVSWEITMKIWKFRMMFRKVGSGTGCDRSGGFFNFQRLTRI